VSNMKCIPALTVDTDKIFWVTRDVFEREFDQRDFHRRDSQAVDRNYSRHWFHEDSQGRLWFRVSTVQIVSGATQFINGRHRTAVLFRETARIPIAFTAGPAQEFADRLGLEQVSIGEPIGLPDLPVVDRPEF
jgi:hypothetical protein